MNGLDLSRQFYEEYGKKMLHEKFSQIESKIAIALIGSGSECMGYDDDISRDHDFDAGFIIFISDDINDKTKFELEREYSYLPNEFNGFKREILSPVGGNRKGVKRISDFLFEKLGRRDANLSLTDFLTIDEEYLLEITNGEIFRDDSEILINIWKKLTYLPNDIKLKKIAGELLIMAQSGQYNYVRAKKRLDIGAGKLSINKFVNSFIHFVFLINEVYMPYYKWQFKSLKLLSWPNLLYGNLIYDNLINLLSVNKDNIFTVEIENMLNELSNICIDRLNIDKLIMKRDNFLESYAYQVNNHIKDNYIRNLNILVAV